MGIIDRLDLKKAFRRIENDRRDDAIRDVVGYRDYKKHLDENIYFLTEQLKDYENYSSSPPLNIDIPKRGSTLRPGIVPFIDDRVIYQGIADLLATHFTENPCVYSNKLADSDSTQMFIQGVELWVSFQNKIEEYCYEYSFVVETDITAYFDHIYHDLMASRISDLFCDNFSESEIYETRAILKKMWGRWNIGYLKNFGIPQINDASSFMANLYLDELDKWLLSRNLVYLRYVDDIRIFTKTESEAKKALAETIVKMREMGLFVASGKTKIKTTIDVLQELYNGRNRISEIEADIDSSEPTRLNSAAEKMEDFFIQLVEAPEAFNDRFFRFCINRYKRLFVSGYGSDSHERVIREIIKRFYTMPESTDIFIDYLSLFTDDERIVISVLDFLESSDNIYPWQEMHFLELLLRLEIPVSIKQRIIRYAISVIESNKHPSCKANAYLLLGKNGTYVERRDIRSHYTNEERATVRKSIIVATQEMRQSERNSFYKGIHNESRMIGQTINYIKDLPKPTYAYFKPPQPYDVNIPDNDSDDLFDMGSEYFI